MRKFAVGIALVFAMSAAQAQPKTTKSPPTALQVDEDAKSVTSRLDAIEKDLLVVKETVPLRLDAQDNRLADMGTIATQQGSAIAAVGNYIAWTSLAIGLLGFLAGLGVYISTARRAQQEAKTTAEKWFAEKAAGLQDQITAIQKQAIAASEQIGKHAKSVETMATAKKAEIDAAAVKLFTSSNTVVDAREKVIAARSVQAINEELKQKPEAEFSAVDHYARGLSFVSQDNYVSALNSFNEAIQEGAKSNSLDPNQLSRAQFARAYVLSRLGREEESLAAYDEIINRKSGFSDPEELEMLARTMVNKGVLLGELGRSAEELDVYDSLLKRVDGHSDDAIAQQVANVLLNKGITYEQLGRIDEAIAVYRDMSERFANTTGSGIAGHVAKAIVNLAATIGNRGDSDAAVRLYDEVIRRYAGVESADVQETVATSMANKAITLSKIGEYEKAIAQYKELISLFLKSTHQSTRRTVAKAMGGCATVYHKLERNSEAVHMAQQLVDNFGAEDDLGLLEFVAQAHDMIGYQDLLDAKHELADENLDRAKELLNQAVHCHRSAVDSYERCEKPNDVALGNLAYALYLLDPSDEEVKRTLKRALRLGGKRLRDIELADARFNRLTQDDGFVLLINRLYEEIQQET